MTINITTPMPGTIVSISVALGEHVSAGQELAIIESMKMEVPIESESSGVINEVVVHEGAVTNEGDVIFRIQPD